MNVYLTGSRGLIGSALWPVLQAAGHSVSALGRGPARFFGEVGAVVHLAGENIAAGRWNAARKDRIRESRVEGTRRLGQALAALPRPPAVLVGASAVGYYGDRGDAWLDEGSPPGSDFLAEVCREWEEAAAPAAARGIRVVHVRFGVVLSTRGGALGRMLAPFRWGVGGPMGRGRQWWSWITLDDAVRAVLHVLARTDLSGPVNAVSPEPATSREFARSLGRVLHRPAFLPVPGFALRLALGEMAGPLLLASARVRPGRLLETGFEFRDPALEPALRSLLSSG